MCIRDSRNISYQISIRPERLHHLRDLTFKSSEPSCTSCWMHDDRCGLWFAWHCWRTDLSHIPHYYLQHFLTALYLTFMYFIQIVWRISQFHAVRSQKSHFSLRKIRFEKWSIRFLYPKLAQVARAPTDRLRVPKRCFCMSVCVTSRTDNVWTCSHFPT